MKNKESLFIKTLILFGLMALTESVLRKKHPELAYAHESRATDVANDGDGQ